ncbi:MAG: exodeoxyribonuclease VII large subunit [Acidobacteriota bacterium]
MTTPYDLPFDDVEPPRRTTRGTDPPRGDAASGRETAPVEAGAPVRRILSVSELTATLREVLETSFPEIWIEGELSNARVWATGHLYFTLKDAHAQIKGVMFRSALRYLKFKPGDGLHVVVRGRVSVYDPKGEYQVVAEHMEPRGYGPLQLAFEQLKKQLAAEGLFDSARKRPLPALPRRIGVVTSIDGAALRDIVRVLHRRYPNLHLVMAPSRVQGEGAAGELARAIRQVGRIEGVDVVIVGRGGGSLEDLWAFNEEKVARAIAASPVPIISAVGHETDFSIADFVADVRAPTPSAAAEMVVGRKDEFLAQIDRLRGRAEASIRSLVGGGRTRLKTLLARPGLAGQPGRVAMRGRHVAELAAALGRTLSLTLGRRARRHETLRRALGHYDPRHRLASIRARLLARDGHLRRVVVERVHHADARARAAAGRLHGLSPLDVLARGYAVCWDESRTRIIREATAVGSGDLVRVTLARGELRCQVTEPILDPPSPER